VDTRVLFAIWIDEGMLGLYFKGLFKKDLDAVWKSGTDRCGVWRMNEGIDAPSKQSYIRGAQYTNAAHCTQ